MPTEWVPMMHTVLRQGAMSSEASIACQAFPVQKRTTAVSICMGSRLSIKSATG